VSNAPSKPVSFSRPKVGYFSNRPRTYRPAVWSVPGQGVKWPVKPTTRLYVMPEAKDVRSYSFTLRTSQDVAFD